MKVSIVLLAVVAAGSCASAGHLNGYAAPAVHSSGSSSQFRSEDNYGNYQFGYDESHASGSSGRREERSGDVVRGSYRLGDADGRQRTVNYVADNDGFRATIHTNEPGVDSAREPAAVLINKEGHAVVPVPEAVVVAAPAPVAFAHPAPVYHETAAPVYHREPVPVGPVHPVAGELYEAPVPRGFAYSFGAAHPSASYAHAAHPAPAYHDAPTHY